MRDILTLIRERDAQPPKRVTSLRTMYQVHAAFGRPLYTLLTHRRACRAVRLMKYLGFTDAYIAGTVRVRWP